MLYLTHTLCCSVLISTHFSYPNITLTVSVQFTYRTEMLSTSTLLPSIPSSLFTTLHFLFPTAHKADDYVQIYIQSVSKDTPL